MACGASWFVSKHQSIIQQRFNWSFIRVMAVVVVGNVIVYFDKVLQLWQHNQGDTPMCRLTINLDIFLASSKLIPSRLAILLERFSDDPRSQNLIIIIDSSDTSQGNV